MDAYTIFKFLHIMAAIGWVGGGLTLLFVGLMAEWQNDKASMAATMSMMAKLGNTWFVPASMLTVVFGLVLAFLGNLWSELWIMLGLAGFAATFCTGLFVLKPHGDRAAALAQEGRLAEAEAIGRQIMQAAKFDYTLMFVVIAIMVFKPAASDVVMLGALGVVLALGAALFLLPALRRPAAVQSA